MNSIKNFLAFKHKHFDKYILSMRTNKLTFDLTDSFSIFMKTNVLYWCIFLVLSLLCRRFFLCVIFFPSFSIEFSPGKCISTRKNSLLFILSFCMPLDYSRYFLGFSRFRGSYVFLSVYIFDIISCDQCTQSMNKEFKVNCLRIFVLHTISSLYQYVLFLKVSFIIFLTFMVTFLCEDFKKKIHKLKKQEISRL